jgi:hypothetical protein
VALSLARRWVIRQVLAGIAGGMGISGIIGYAINVKFMRTLQINGSAVEISLPSAIGLLALSLSQFIFPTVDAVKALLRNSHDKK